MKIAFIALCCFLSFSSFAPSDGNPLVNLLVNGGKQWVIIADAQGGCCGAYTFAAGGSVQAGSCPSGMGGSIWVISQQSGKNVIKIGSNSYELQFVEIRGQKNMILRTLTINDKGRYPEYIFK